METKKTTLSAKAIIHQKFGSEACYKVEEVRESNQTECPGLNISQKGPCLFRCKLQLPELSVVSGTFKKKKDAEQSAAEMALEKLGVQPVKMDPTPQEARDGLVSRISYLFSEKFLSSLHPLSGHFGAALWRKKDLYGSIPVSVIAVYDSKFSSLCKFIDPDVELNPVLVIYYIMNAATELSEILVTSEQHLWLKRQSPYPQEIIESLMAEDGPLECIRVGAIRIPSAVENPVEAVTLQISSEDYYLDVIASELGLKDAAEVLISRNVGKASSETRVFFAAPTSYPLVRPSDMLSGKETLHFQGSLNLRASYLVGQDIFGDAILASIAYIWKSKDLFYEDVTVQSYYRMLLGKTPSGIYKLSREAVFAAELPSAFTTRANWRGSLPRDILNMFCRQHRLSEPVFSIIKASSESPGSCSKAADATTKETGSVTRAPLTENAKQSEESGCMFQCQVNLLSKCGYLIIKCSPKDCSKKQNDAIQNACLKLLSWLNEYFKNLHTPLEKLYHTADIFDVQIHSKNLLKEFIVCQSLHNTQLKAIEWHKLLESICINTPYTLLGFEVCSLKIEGPDSGVFPCSGSLPCINYSVSLVVEGENMRERLEVCDEFEFEIGVQAVVPFVEVVVTQMSVGQSAIFTTNLAPSELILASVHDPGRTLSLLSSGELPAPVNHIENFTDCLLAKLLQKSCCMGYEITLNKVTEPLEERMEQALFSPPLSKQRVEFAVGHIKECCAATLIDFGCGSGSLLEALLNYPTSLERIVGIDISQKGLIRAAKVLNSKLAMNSDAACIRSVVLYEGSITDFDTRLHGFDIGTCLEVIEHMEEDQACLFGDVVLGSFRPRILIVSTPNFEYNVVLQKSNPTSQEQEESGEKSQLLSCKFRNHDHKFEWTREQFSHWASDLAARHNYSVDFSGVGGSADVEPGFASQIAVFKRDSIPGKDVMKVADLEHHYNVMWEWNSSNK